MGMFVEAAEALLAAARGLVAAFGGIYLVINVLLPCVAALARFFVVYLPEEWANWRLYRAQQAELRRLEVRIGVLRKRMLRRSAAETVEALSDVEGEIPTSRGSRGLQKAATTMDASDGQSTTIHDRIRHAEKKQTQPRPQRQPRQQRQQPLAAQSNKKIEYPVEEKREVRTRRPIRPLQLLSPNLMRETRHVPTFLKASKGIVKPQAETKKAHAAPPQKSQVLSLEDIFGEADQENRVDRLSRNSFRAA